VAGESHGRSGSPSDGSPGSGADPKPMDATGATRRLLSRPMRVVSTTFKSVGDGITVLGDATERMAGEALGIVPDAFGVLQSGVGALRKRVEFDVNDNRQDWRSGAEAEKGRGRERVGGNGGGEGTGHTPFWLGAHRGATGAGGSALASRGPWGRSRPGSAGGNGRATPRDYGGSAPLPARASSAKTKPYGRASKAKLDGRLTPEHVFIGPRATPHVALALVCLALCARLAGGGPLGLLAAVACGVACVGYLRVVEAAQQAELLRVAEARAMRGWQLRVGAPAESVGWLNAVLAAGWETTFGCAGGVLGLRARGVAAGRGCARCTPARPPVRTGHASLSCTLLSPSPTLRPPGKPYQRVLSPSYSLLTPECLPSSAPPTRTLQPAPTLKTFPLPLPPLSPAPILHSPTPFPGRTYTSHSGIL
jgi:hypothetical protein